MWVASLAGRGLEEAYCGVGRAEESPTGKKGWGLGETRAVRRL